MSSPYSQKNIQKIKQLSSPKILLNVCTHGNEQVGLRVADYFKDVQPVFGHLVINIANTRAVEKNKRFIKDDLNRVFPGKEHGSYEEKLAHKMKPFIESFDVVIDVHSTESGVTSSLIIVDYTPKIKSIVQAISPKRVIHMRATKSNSLISCAKVGIGFEYGKDKSVRTYNETVQGIKRLLVHYKMLTPKQSPRKSTHPVELYEATHTVAKPEGFVVLSRIKNFSLIKKGEPLGYNTKTKEKIFAKEDFYPVLFGKNTYGTIFGFAAKKRLL